MAKSTSLTAPRLARRAAIKQTTRRDTIMALRQKPRGRGLGLQDDLQYASSSSLQFVPASLFATQEMASPQSEAALEQLLGTTIQFFNPNQANQRPGYVTSMLSSNSVPFPFLVRGIGLVVTVETDGFTIPGAAVTNPNSLAGATIPSPVPPFSGVVPFDGLPATASVGGVPAYPADPLARPATLEWGSWTWRASQALLMAYRFQLTLLGRYLLVDELGTDMGSVEADINALGFGQSQLPTQEFVNNFNAAQVAAGGTNLFLAPNSTAGGAALGPVLANASFGSVSLPGIFQCHWYEIDPLLLLPGMPLQFELTRVPNEDVYYDRLVSLFSVASEVTPADGIFTDEIAGATGYAAEFPFKGGYMRIGISLKGWELTDSACLAYYYSQGPRLPADVYEEAMPQLRRRAVNCGLRGVPEVHDLPTYVAPAFLSVDPDGTRRPTALAIEGRYKTKGERDAFVEKIKGLGTDVDRQAALDQVTMKTLQEIDEAQIKDNNKGLSGDAA
jgi:hypothetical protein